MSGISPSSKEQQKGNPPSPRAKRNVGEKPHQYRELNKLQEEQPMDDIDALIEALRTVYASLEKLK
ncbi:MAG TPA: hypothetical protein VGT44_02895, partial [Ktedonobacteraceae bacterium]|nr:hypothetical protein [Ktedonobacteraceae bacterium]